MIGMIVYILISLVAIIYVASPIAYKHKVFKYGQNGFGNVVSISPFLDFNKKERYKIEVRYDVNNRTFKHTFSLRKNDCQLKNGDIVCLIYDTNSPENAHISADTDSLYTCFQRLIITLTSVVIFAIALKNVLIYFSPLKQHSIISFMSLGYAALVFLCVIVLYAYINAQLSRSKNDIEGEVIDKIVHKSGNTYRVRYTAKNCDFTLLCNLKDEIDIGSVIKVTYLDCMPFISRITK